MGHSLRQHTLISTLGALVFAIPVGGCATASPSSAFQIPEEQFHSKVKRIALAPIAVPSQLGVSEPAKLRFDALIEAKLQEAGFTTFPAKEWGEAFTRIQQEAGGLFDPRTGELDDAKVKTILLRTVEELRGRFQLDAILFPRVHVVKAKFTGAWARWDGASDSLTSGLSVLATSGISGTVPALTLGREHRQPRRRAGAVPARRGHSGIGKARPTDGEIVRQVARPRSSGGGSCQRGAQPRRGGDRPGASAEETIISRRGRRISLHPYASTPRRWD